jgi:hypothetical protein
MKPLLTMKHWQIFVAVMGGVLIFEFIAFSSIFSTVSSNNKPEPSDFTPILIIMPIMMVYTMYFTYGWQWAIISLLREKLPAGIKMNHKRIKAFVIIPIVYMLVLVIGMMLFFSEIINEIDPEHYFQNHKPGPALALIFLLIIPLHLFSIFCIFHTMYFAAKTIKAVELQKDVTFNDFAGEFFLIWFNIIGLWILQPKLNKMISGEKKASAEVLDDPKNEDQEVL